MDVSVRCGEKVRRWGCGMVGKTEVESRVVGEYEEAGVEL